MTSERLAERAGHLGIALARRGWRVTTAESCTGGWVSQAITSIAGSSAWFDVGYVTYSNVAKQRMLSVSAAALAAHGAVSEAVVKEMARGALLAAEADCAIAVSGIAGPGGGSEEKPVGTVWCAWVTNDVTLARMFRFEGSREAVRRQSVVAAIEGLLALLE